MVSRSLTFLLVGVLIGGISGYGVSYVYSPQALSGSADQDILSRLGSLEESLSQLGSVFNRLSDLETTAASIPNLADQVLELEERIEEAGGTPGTSDLSAFSNDISQLDNRLNSVEDSIGQITSIGSRLDMLESQLDDVEVETARISGVESQVSTLSNSISSLSSSVNNLINTDSQHNSDINNLVSQLASVQNELSSIENSINVMITDIECVQAYSLLKYEMMNPGSLFASSITDEIFNNLRYSESTITQWIGIVGSSVVKNILGAALDSTMPSLVWNDFWIASSGNHQYTTYIVSYFPIVLDTGLPIIGEITIAQVGLVVTATVNVQTEIVSNFDVYDVFV